MVTGDRKRSAGMREAVMQGEPIGKSNSQREAHREGGVGLTYDQIITDMRKSLLALHEYSCGTGDMYDSLGRHTDGQLAELIAKTGDANYKVIETLERMLSTLGHAEERSDALLKRTLEARTPKRSRRKTILGVVIGAIVLLMTFAAAWMGGARTGQTIGYSQAFEALAEGGLIQMTRHGDWVDLMMGPCNPKAATKDQTVKPSMRVDARRLPQP